MFLLNFMYTGEVTVGQEELDSFLEAGEALGVEGLGAVRTSIMPGLRLLQMMDRRRSVK